jgi:hypothetical protein
MPVGLYASSAKLVFKLSGTLGNSTNEPTPYFIASSTSNIIDFIECRKQPGIEEISSW